MPWMLKVFGLAIVCAGWVACHPFEELGDYPFGGDDVMDATGEDTSKDTDTNPPVCSCPEIAGAACCNATCVNVLTDPSNCGECGRLCPEGAECKEGQCEGGSGCPDGLSECEGECVDVMNHPRFCGACDRACEADNGGFGFCQGGECYETCTWPEADCSGAGRCDNNLAKDPLNCGECGKECKDEQRCVEGDCKDTGCPRPFATCEGAAGECVINLDADPNNCGACGQRCGEGEVCELGRCLPVVTTCEPPDDACVNQETGEVFCADVLSDSRNCGECGNSCTYFESCQNGECMGSIVCPAGLVQCVDDCVDITADDDNCGDCGVKCSDTQSCYGGVCIDDGRCMPPMLDCAVQGLCNIDIRTNPLHCGGCNQACDASAGQICSEGQCDFSIPPGCPPPSADCDFNGSCETDTSSDPKNCGLCGNDCGNGFFCSNGLCDGTTPTCSDPSHAFCPEHGGCVDIMFSPDHCGNCSTECTGPCINGVCEPPGSPCPGPQFADCDNDPTTCEDLYNDPMNCGRCEKACPNGQCSQGNCL